MKKIFFPTIVIVLFSCNNQEEPKSVSTTKQSLTTESEIIVTEPSETSEGKIHGVYGGCGYNNTPDETTITLYYPRPREISQINSILKFSGLSSNFKIYAANIDNAVATIIDNKRYILYDPSLLSSTDEQSKSYWSSMSILAHEIGHHLSGHTLTNKGSNPHDEIEADKFSGFVLYKLGASLSQATKAIQTLGSDVASITHPAKSDRIKAITKGWNEANQTRYSGAIPPPPSDDISSFHTYTYDMLIEEKNINANNGCVLSISEDEYANYDFFYGIITEAKVVDDQVEKFKVYIKRTGNEWKKSVGSLNGESIDVHLDDYWHSPKVARVPSINLPYLLVPGRRIKFSFYEGLCGGSGEGGYFRLTYVKGLEGNSF